MEEAWEKGISPMEYRRCFSSDIQNIHNIQNIRADIRRERMEQAEHQRKVEDVMKQMQGLR